MANERQKPKPLVLSKLQKARVRLLVPGERVDASKKATWSFWADLAMNLRLVEDESIPTACTDGRVIRYNPHWIEPQSMDECIKILVHEVAHPVFGHCNPARIGGRLMIKWNMAADHFVNNLLKECGLVQLPGELCDAKYSGWATERIYMDLPDPKLIRQKGGQGEGGNGDPFYDPLYGGVGKDIEIPKKEDGKASSPEEAERIEREWKERAAKAAARARQQGKLPASLDRLLEDLFHPKISWKDKFRRWLVLMAGSDDITWIPASRRYIDQELYFPSWIGYGLGKVVFVVDTSGSMSHEEVKQGVSEAEAILQTFNLELWIVYADADVAAVERYGRGETYTLKGRTRPKGGGGTSFVPAFDWVRDNNIRPQALIYVTDTYGTFPDQAPNYPVLWLTTERHEVPWGEQITLDVDELAA